MPTLDLFSITNAANIVLRSTETKILGTTLKPLQMLAFLMTCISLPA